ncbi:MAG: S1 RNA-binding domain-containing protein [Synergistaceae bacterium]|nr:S1 RNA-binding domain-containing protein [Synergistaceae bacterium]
MEVMVEQYEENMESMESLLQQDASANIRKGAEATGRVHSKTENGWLVDVGYKCEGFLPAKEWSHRILIGDAPEPQINDEITVKILSFREGEEAQLLVSRWRGEIDRRWKELEEKIAESENKTIKVKGVRKVKGGLMVECCGLEGFIPISHLVGEKRGGNLNKFINEEFDAELLENKRDKHRLVFSRKSMLENEIKSAKDRFYDDIREGTELEGEVSSLTAFGVFVNIGPFDGLVHTSELSWKRSTKLKDSFKKGDKVKVKVIGIDREINRISLSIKQTISDPWDTVAERWQQGMTVKSSITNVTDFGAFVELEPGVEGLIHIGDISWSRIKHPKEVLRKGQEVEVSILDVDILKHRISLGYKQLNDPWKVCIEKYEKGQDVNVKVVRLTDFGAFVELEDGVEGLIHISQLSHKRVEHPKDVLEEKQEITAKIIEMSPEQRRIRLSLSALEEKPEKTEQNENQGGDKRERPGKKREHGNKDKEHKEAYVPDGETSVSIGEFLKSQTE